MKILDSPKKIIGCKLKDKLQLMESQSGGAFTSIAEFFLKIGAVVYGCGMDEKNNAIYKRITKIDDLIQIKGSKYVQAKVEYTYLQISQDLEMGRKVLFSGTPCYVSAMNNFFSNNKNYCNLYTVDLICHGVPSPKVYYDYLNALENKNKSKIVSFVFRDKKKAGWHKHIEKIVYANNKEEYAEAYTQLFYTNLPLRPSCGKCQYSSMQRPGDFTVGDYWGIEESNPQFDDNCGVSLLFLNTDRAVIIFEKIKDKLEYFYTDKINSIRQPNLIHSSVIPSNKEKFWSDYTKKGIKYCINFYSPIGIPFRIKRKIKYLICKS